MAFVKTRSGEEFFVQSEVVSSQTEATLSSSSLPDQLVVRAFNGKRSFKAAFKGDELMTSVSKQLIAPIEAISFAHALVQDASLDVRSSAFDTTTSLKEFVRAEFKIKVVEGTGEGGLHAQLGCLIFKRGREKGGKVLNLKLAQVPSGSE